MHFKHLVLASNTADSFGINGLPVYGLNSFIKTPEGKIFKALQLQAGLEAFINPETSEFYGTLINSEKYVGDTKCLKKLNLVVLQKLEEIFGEQSLILSKARSCMFEFSEKDDFKMTEIKIKLNNHMEFYNWVKSTKKMKPYHLFNIGIVPNSGNAFMPTKNLYAFESRMENSKSKKRYI